VDLFRRPSEPMSTRLVDTARRKDLRPWRDHRRPTKDGSEPYSVLHSTAPWSLRILPARRRELSETPSRLEAWFLD
jgi:hypothetical protein